MKKLIPVLFIGLLTVIFFWQFFMKNLLPIPSDTIIGLYHPFRDLYVKNYPNGIPFKNFLITDPVRQQYPWRELAISIEKKLELPLWNPYNLSGTPLLANFQSATFYPFNILFFILPFTTAWSLIIFLGPFLGGIFLFSYLNNLNLSKWASVLGAITFSFSGFFVAWMEWGTITHVALWLPLILLAIDKIFTHLISGNSKLKTQNSKIQVKSKNLIVWNLILIFLLISSFFAGHLQTFFYLFVFSWVYFLARWLQHGKIFKILFVFLIFNILFLILTAVQWLPTLQFINLSARNVDLIGYNNPGWFIPWQNLIQFLVPDFFGNPTTLNYWGIWNYGEFVGYVGITPFILAIFSIFRRFDKKTLFFGTAFFTSLIFSLPNFVSKIPFALGIPFLQTAQPTRLLFIADFSLAVLAALGFDYFLKNKNKIFPQLIFVALIFAGAWSFVLFGFGLEPVNLSVAKNNLILPSIIFLISAILLFFMSMFPKLNLRLRRAIYFIIVLLVVFDLFRFAWKFTPFTEKKYLFPSTSAIAFLQKNIGEFRIMSTDSRIFPPNFSAIYRLKSIDGYDPLYLLRYGELIAVSEREKADISPPFGFNRIITPHNYDSKIVDLLGIKYVLSLSELDSPKLKKVFQEGETKVYENTNVVPRAFFVSKIVIANDNKKAIGEMFGASFNFSNMAIVENPDKELQNIKRTEIGKANIAYYSENKVVIETENSGIGFLVFTDSFYSTWKVKIDSRKENIYRTDYNFRGVIVPAGKHKVEFYTTLL